MKVPVFAQPSMRGEITSVIETINKFNYFVKFQLVDDENTENGINITQLRDSVPQSFDPHKTVFNVSSYFSPNVFVYKSEYAWILGLILVKCGTIITLGIRCQEAICFLKYDTPINRRNRVRGTLCAACKKKLPEPSRDAQMLTHLTTMLNRFFDDKYASDRFKTQSLAEILRKSSAVSGRVIIDEKFLMGVLDEDASTKGKLVQRDVGIKTAADIARLLLAESRTIQSIDKILANSHNIDVVLYLTQKRYREHYFHQFSVASLGQFLLGLKVSDSQTLLRFFVDTIQTKYKSSVTEADLFSGWWICATLHDSAYPLAYFMRVMTSISAKPKFLNFDVERIVKMLFIKDSYADGIRNFVADKLTAIKRGKIAPTIFEKEIRRSYVSDLHGLLGFNVAGDGFFYQNSLNGHFDLFDHGMWSVINILQMINEMGENLSDIVKEKPCIMEAVEAILLHNLELGDESKIHIAEHPFAFLLRLCDELHEWDRPLVGSEGFLRETDHITLEPLVELRDGTYYPQILTVVFRYTRPELLRKVKWDFRIFCEHKEKVFKKLRFFEQGKNLYPQGINFVVSVPFSWH